MPTLTITHEAPLELIRQHADLAVELVRALTGLLTTRDVTARPGPTSLNAVIPAEFTADAVVIVSDKESGEPVLVVIVETQGRDDRTKAYSWPAYLANVREAVQCPSAILFLACLPALDMETADGARRVLAAIRDTQASHANRKRLATIIMKRASDAARQILEDLMTNVEWKDDFIESYVQIGVDQGVQIGEERGVQRGAAATKAADILTVLDVRGLKPTKAQRGKVTADAGLPQLDIWFQRALTAETAADVFKDTDQNQN